MEQVANANDVSARIRSAIPVEPRQLFEKLFKPLLVRPESLQTVDLQHSPQIREIRSLQTRWQKARHLVIGRQPLRLWNILQDFCCPGRRLIRIRGRVRVTVRHISDVIHRNFFNGPNFQN